MQRLFGLLVLLLLLPNLARAEAQMNWWEWQSVPLQQPQIIDQLEWQADGIGLAQGARHGTLITAPFRSAIAFDTLNLRWRGTGEAQLRLRTSADNRTWSAWHDASAHTHHTQSAHQLYSGQQLWFAENQQFVQLELQLRADADHPAPWLADLELLLITRSAIGTQTLPAQQLGEVVSRSAWGNPDGEQSPNWEPEHYPVTHVVLHHTATNNLADDWAAVVRAIWLYHAVSQGWGDIGYHYLIDPNGVVYQGRAGGDTAEAGHTLSYNQGSIGIALLGCLDSGCDDGGFAPSAAALQATEHLLYAKSLQHGINLAAEAYDARERLRPVLSGHGDLLATDCPGDLFAPEIERFRSIAPMRMYAPLVTRGE
jgi:hypothetical protein